MSFPDFPQVPACQSLNNMRIWRDEVEKWKKEHEELLREFFEWLEGDPSDDWGLELDEMYLFKKGLLGK